MSLFFLEVFEHVHKNKVKEYESLGTFIDKKVEETEPGMLIHVQNKVSENEHEVVYRWLSVYEKFEDLQVHQTGEHVQAYMQKIGDGILSAPLEVFVYCDWTEEQKEPFRHISGMSLTFAPIVNGYFR